MTLPMGYGHNSSPSSPDYVDLGSKENMQELTNNRIPQGSLNKGAILTKDSLEIPLEIAFGINNDRSGASRPSLSPLFRTRFIDDHQVNDLSRSYYQELRNDLPADLLNKLVKDEAFVYADERDPDLIALDNSLKFEATVLAFADNLSVSLADEDEGVLIAAQQFVALPNVVKQELLSYGSEVNQFLDDHLAKIGPNDLSYDLLLNVSNQMKEAYQLFSSPAI